MCGSRSASHPIATGVIATAIAKLNFSDRLFVALRQHARRDHRARPREPPSNRFAQTPARGPSTRPAAWSPFSLRPPSNAARRASLPRPPPSPAFPRSEIRSTSPPQPAPAPTRVQSSEQVFNLSLGRALEHCVLDQLLQRKSERQRKSPSPRPAAIAKPLESVRTRK